MALDLAPNEGFYYQQQANALRDQALATSQPAERDSIFQKGATSLDRARAASRQSVDPLRVSAAYYVTWANSTQNGDLRSKRADMALDFCLQAAQMMANPDTLVTCGAAYELKGQYDRAIMEYQRAVEIDPTLTRPYVDIARNYQKQGNAKDAAAAYQRALAGNPTLTEARLALVSLYLEQGYLQAALTQANEAVSQNPNDFYSHRSLIDVYRKLGQTQEALKEASMAQNLAPADQQASLAKLIEELNVRQQ